MLCLSTMDQNKNYNLIYKETVKELASAKKRPTLFLHACCGPCLTYPLTELVNYFNVTVGYINRNIYPEEEFKLREKELIRFVDEFNKEKGLSIKVITTPYEYEDLAPELRKYGPELEGGNRCTFCHYIRMSLAYKYAYEHSFDYFATVMTVSSKKPSRTINEIGIRLEKKYIDRTKFLQSDFKKESGQLKGIMIAKEHNLYRQCYCGCEFSLEARKEQEANRNKA